MGGLREGIPEGVTPREIPHHGYFPRVPSGMYAMGRYPLGGKHIFSLKKLCTIVTLRCNVKILKSHREKKMFCSLCVILEL